MYRSPKPRAAHILKGACIPLNCNSQYSVLYFWWLNERLWRHVKVKTEQPKAFTMPLLPKQAIFKLLLYKCWFEFCIHEVFIYHFALIVLHKYGYRTVPHRHWIDPEREFPCPRGAGKKTLFKSLFYKGSIIWSYSKSQYTQLMMVKQTHSALIMCRFHAAHSYFTPLGCTSAPNPLALIHCTQARLSFIIFTLRLRSILWIDDITTFWNQATTEKNLFIYFAFRLYFL